MKKRKTLPSNFSELLEKGDIEALKAVFDKCEINAVSTYGNAFNETPLPREFAFWLKEQGCDINLKNRYGETPIFSHASSYLGDVALLLELGADGNEINSDRETPLHYAAKYGRIDAVNALLKYGVNVNARSKDSLTGEKFTPLEITLDEKIRQENDLLIICKALIDAGAKITRTSKKLISKIGKEREYFKAQLANSNDVDMTSFLAEEAGMKGLYELFSVKPEKAINLDIHDGVSKIKVKEKNTKKAFQKLWDYLVPNSGAAATAQGEVIRIVGKVCREILDNGGINWDNDFRKMLKSLLQYFQMGNSLPKKDIGKIQVIVDTIYNGDFDEICEELIAYAVSWVGRNPDLLALIPPTYKR